MEQEQQEQKTQKRGFETIAKFFYISARFTWFFGIIITAIVFFSLYRFVIQPQYRDILVKQEEVKQLNLQGEKTALIEHLKRIQEFISLSSAITQEDKHNLQTLLQDAPDELVLRIQFERFLEKYSATESSVTIHDPVFTNIQEDVVGDVPQSRESIIDLSNFFEDGPNVDAPVEEDKVPTIVLGTIPIDISISFTDYFLAKDFIRDIEGLVPLIDITTIAITTTAPRTPETEGTETSEEPIENLGEASVSVSGFINIATER
jgi:hypothetical protein